MSVPSCGPRVPLRGATVVHGLVACLAIAVSACSGAVQPAQFAGPTMGTTYHVTVSGADSLPERRAVQSAIDRVLVETERHLSTYDDTSEIALLNRDESRSWQDVSPTLFVVLQQARDVSQLTAGSFDVTVAPLLRLWGYEPGSAGPSAPTTFQAPTSGQLDQVRTSVGYAKLELRSAPRMSVRKSASGMQLTVDGIAPGYAVDRIANALRVLGHADFIVEIGAKFVPQVNGRRAARGESRSKRRSRPGVNRWLACDCAMPPCPRRAIIAMPVSTGRAVAIHIPSILALDARLPAR